MMRQPVPALRPFVDAVWADEPPAGPLRPLREHALPTGAMHLVFRLDERPLTIVDADGAAQRLPRAVVGGARARYYVRVGSAPAYSAGAVLRPGAAAALFAVAAGELAARHTPLADLWGDAATGGLCASLAEAGSAAAALVRLEAALLARLPRVHGMHPAIAAAVATAAAWPSIAAAVRDSGLSHRRFGELFHRHVGLTPKAYARVLRLQRTLAALQRAPAADRGGGEPADALADIAAWAGYSDQSHLHRDFVACTGLTPQQYRAIAPAQRNHVEPGTPRRP